MSQANRSAVQVGCPECDSTIAASLPAGPGISDTGSNRLQGRETCCQNCGHELELYYY
ncbi:hypothetical protein [Halopiger xanaduensis]|uniref:Small CPxCG-related zinc finger protein n=1 Tax=Halopiger xanaduensis (strain DSM 18323 / JCM 14033 / SH-6) TaxID=797210 RepID=F8D5X9_HALXS|nr:hypothetical protein [Halopiger xanaduensis]AEH37706.1 hypothetical protein Halxa_3092 [Halopiger xanaduensis SH-6]